jgi:streptogramin lyase
MWFWARGQQDRQDHDERARDRRDPSNNSLAGIVLGPDGAMWFTETRANKIDRIDTTAPSSVPVPSGSLPGGIVASLDGSLWFTAQGRAASASGGGR